MYIVERYYRACVRRVSGRVGGRNRFEANAAINVVAIRFEMTVMAFRTSPPTGGLSCFISP